MTSSAPLFLKPLIGLLVSFLENFMAQYIIAVIVGSLRKDSINKKLSAALQKLFPPDFSFTQVRIDDLPLYNQDHETNPPMQVRRLKGEVKAAQGVLFVTPEFNRSIPGALKNALDHASRPYGHSVWNGKPAGVIGTSPGATGTGLAQQHLRNILAYLNMPTLGQPEAFIQNREGMYEPDGSLSEASRKFLQSWVDAYVAWIKKHA